MLGWQLPKLPRASETAKAINYGLNHWDGLTRFLGDGGIEIDTNTVERTIRPSHSIERMHSSLAATKAAQTGRSSRR